MLKILLPVLIILIGLSLIKCPIYVSILGAAIYLQLAVNHMSLTNLFTGFFEAMTKNSLMAVPFFMVAGSIIAASSLGRRLIDVFIELLKRVRGGFPVACVLAINKMDSTGHTDPDIYEFYNLGLGDPYPISAVHGHGTGDLLDACFAYFPPETEEEEDDEVVKVAIIGKPNVGKSSLTNRLLGEERVIVSDVAGTTRDAVDSYLENETGKYLIIDTAGMRKKSKVDDRVEKFSVLRAAMAIERSDVCLILIDANEGVTEQDTKVAGMAHEAGKACIIAVNKWDAVEKDDKTMKRMEEEVRRDLSYMTYAPVIFISALTGQRVNRLFALIQAVVNQAALRIPTGVLNQVLADAQARVQPPTDKGRRLKIYYMTQIGVKPPHFVIFCNDAKLFHFSYQRYLENQIRSTFALTGTPVRITIRQKGDKEE